MREEEPSSAPEILSQLDRISDPEQSTAFHNKNRDEIHRAFEARKSNPLTLKTMIKTQSPKPKTLFPSAPLPWTWNCVPAGGIPTRWRCLSVGTPKEREQAVAFVASYRAQEELSSANDIALCLTNWTNLVACLEMPTAALRAR